MKAVVIGSMNCMPTEYAILLRQHSAEVVHYYDGGASDTLSNPTLRWGEDSSKVTNGILLRKIRFPHHFAFIFPKIFQRELLHQMVGADIILLSGPSISLARLIQNEGKKIVALSYGNDISHYCNRAWPKLAVANVRGLKRIFKPVLQFMKSWFVDVQIDGFRSCTHYSYFLPGFDLEIDTMIESILKKSSDIQRLPKYAVSFKFLEQGDFVDQLPHLACVYKILFPVRFSDENELLGNKGWKLLFDGLKKYKLISKRPFKCICFKKGDFFAAQIYVRAIGIEELIEWKDVVAFDSLVQYYRSSDVVVEQLGSHIMGQGLFAMALGKPVISRASTPKQAEFFKDSGLLDVNGIDSLVGHFVSCESEEFATDIGNKSKEFVQTKANVDVEFLAWGIL